MVFPTNTKNGRRNTIGEEQPISLATLPFMLQNTTKKTSLSSSTSSSPALNLAPLSRWTLRDKAAQRWLALRSAS